LLDESFAGRVIDKDFLKDLPANVDPCGENGEFHTFVYDGPIFKGTVQYKIGEKVLREYKALSTDKDECLSNQPPSTSMVFWFVGKPFLALLGVTVSAFAVGGSIVIFLLGLEMVLGHEIFKSDKDAKAGTVVPVAFPVIAGSGTLTTVMSLRANFEEINILLGI